MLVARLSDRAEYGVDGLPMLLRVVALLTVKLGLGEGPGVPPGPKGLFDLRNKSISDVIVAKQTGYVSWKRMLKWTCRRKIENVTKQMRLNTVLREGTHPIEMPVG